MSEKIRWGILGLGKIAHKFAAGLTSVEGARLEAVASRSEEKAHQFANQYQAPHYFGSYEVMLESDTIDIVYIATPHVLHYENTMMALEARKAVLCEKPFAMNYQEVEEMVRKAQEKKLFLMEGLWTKFLPPYQKVSQIVRGDRLGNIRSLQADFGFKAPYLPDERLFNKALGGGALLDVGIYPLFLATSLLGRPEKIMAQAIFGDTGVDEDCGMLLNYPSKNCYALLSASIVADNSLEVNIFGTEARLRMSHPFFTPYTRLEMITEHIKAEPVDFEFYGNGYNYEAAEASQCLRDGRIEGKTMSHQDSLFLIEMLDWVRAEAGIHY